ncbi:Helix-turn-helix domain-containing protein [Desulfotomaculum arcticum]|uniref:Helix-turn-helix domain-containing protein n=1 Tax=Desulfotruncus arcticus DSM 17038 TaxID=1121424 RepID=A0A1I2YAN2_9FIRM|nr:helix-turn-helix domain-containing protein [Desulfotruncus arcticus]SFH22784.1 Helix-turn-helix domain-containing protein [Desulfotomaculum arcticum] [Desulfotruncus arcticus DSM 17038]
MSEVYFRVYTQAFRSGLVRALGKERWLLLTVLASYMDESGKCYPTQEQLAQDMGVSRYTVIRLIALLKDFTFNGKPIITVEKHGNGFNNNNVYSILPNALIAIFNGQVNNDTSNPGMLQPYNYLNGKTSQETNTNNIQLISNTTVSNDKELLKDGRAVATYFAHKYRETYNVNYSINWGRDGANGKKLLRIFTPDQLKDIIDVVLSEYEERWKNSKYPRPTLGQIASWLGNEAMALVEQVKEREARLEAAEQEQPQDVEAIMARLNRKKV